MDPIKQAVIRIYFAEYKVGHDPHTRLAEALGITRVEAKKLAYQTIYNMPFINSLLSMNEANRLRQESQRVYQD